MKIRKLPLVIAGVFLVALAGLFFVAAQKLPGLVREKLTAALSQATGAQVTIGSVELHIWRGIVVSGLKIPSPDDPKTNLAEIKELSANFLFLPWLKGTKIFIPNLSVRGTRLALTRRPDKTLDIDRFLKGGGASSAGPAPVLVKNLAIDDLTVVFRDAALTPEAVFTLSVPRARGNLAGTQVLVEANVSIARDKIKTDLVLDGRYGLTDRKITARISTQELTPDLGLPYIPALPVDLKALRAAPLTLGIEGTLPFLSGRITGTVKGLHYKQDTVDAQNGVADLDLTFKADTRDIASIQAAGTLTLRSLAVIVTLPQGKFEGELGDSPLRLIADKKALGLNGTLRLASGRAVAGDLTASGLAAVSTFKISQPFPAEGPAASPAYEGEASVTCEKVSGVPSIGAVDNIQAQLVFANGAITLKEARAGVLNTPVSAMGKFDQGGLEAVVKGMFDVADLTRFIPDNIELPGYKVSGMTDVTVRLSRAATAEAALVVLLEAHLKDLWLHIIDNDIELSADAGDVRVDLNGQSVDWDLPGVIFNKESYGLSGSLNGFGTPSVSANLKGPFYSVAVELIVQARRILVNSLEARTKHSQIVASGAYDTAARTFNATGEVLIDAQDLLRLAPRLKTVWDNARLSGQLLTQVELSGPVSDVRAWKVRANASSRALSFYGYHAEGVAIDYQQVEREGFLNNLTFNAYKGRGLVKGRVTLNDKLSWALRGAIDGLDLEALKMDTAMKDKTFFGTAAIELSVQGAGADTASITGGGRLSIKDGNIWEFNPLKGLGNFLFIPKFSNLIFTNAAGDIYIRDAKVGSDNLELAGPELGLLVQGAMSFAGDLDLVVTTQAPLPAGATSPVGEIVQSVTRVGSMTAIEVTGTTKEPKYKLRAVGQNIAQRISDVVSNILP